ncbi:MAG: sialate O-acetylesterase [Phycisphaerae bacterium]|nr:sialate O-acetylesterase [Phycisphaerae bacterium]
MMRFKAAVLAAMSALAIAVPTARAEVRLAALFSDGMVLQQERPVRIWGTAEAGEKVSVSVAGAKGEATADAQGRWSVEVGPLKAGGPHELTVAGTNTLTVKDVLVGEVWLCSGQSNMEMRVGSGVFGRGGSPESEKQIAEANYPQLRMFTVQRAVAGEPAADVKGQWSVCQGREVLKWSAAGYFFGRELHQKLNVPVGLIVSSVGGSRIDAWMSQESLLAAAPTAKAGLESWAAKVAAFDEAAFQKELAEWQVAADKAKAEGGRAPRKPERITESMRRLCGLYNGMIRPLVPYGIRGVIWYQGESDAGSAAQYRLTFPGMIHAWRNEWGQGEFPFVYVQIANYRARYEEPTESAWAELRNVQRLTLSAVPKTAMAVAIDIGEAEDIHPKNKLDVGRRLALGALAVAYDQKLVYSGPLVAGAKAEGGAVRLSFDSVGGGLVAKGETLKGFTVAGADGKYVWAQAKIDGATVVVSSDAVAEPVSVRYAWADNPECNLYNAEGLPASPFQVAVEK